MIGRLIFLLMANSSRLLCFINFLRLGRNTLAFDFTSLSLLYFFVALGIYMCIGFPIRFSVFYFKKGEVKSVGGGQQNEFIYLLLRCGEDKDESEKDEDILKRTSENIPLSTIINSTRYTLHIQCFSFSWFK